MHGIYDLARGRWRDILPRLGISSKFLKKRNGPCPACGGKDRFWFDDRHKDGDYICRQCGAGKGIKLLMKAHGWEFRYAVEQVRGVLGGNGKRPFPLVPVDRASVPSYEPVKATRDAALWLRKYRPLKLPEFMCRHEPQLEEWINRERPFGFYLGDSRYEGSDLMNIRLKRRSAV